MRETISIYIGQAGVQIGQACWDLYCLEHGLPQNGILAKSQPVVPGTDCLFTQSKSQPGKYTPRAIFVDLDAIPVDSVRTGLLKDLFIPEQLISHKQDSCSIYARAKYTIGKEIIDNVTQQIRKQVEQCDSLDAIQFVHSTAGGMGSGFHGLLYDRLKDIKCKKVNLSLMPSTQLQTNPLSYYNAVLGFMSQHDSNLDIVIQNEAIIKVLNSACQVTQPDIPDINKLIAQTNSQILNYRFGQGMDLSFSSIAASIVPYPAVPFASLSTFTMLEDDAVKTNFSASFMASQSIRGTEYYMTQLDYRHGKFLGMVPLFRGNVSYNDVKAAMSIVSTFRTVQFTDYMPDGYTIGLTKQKPAGTCFPATLTTIATTTAIAEIFSRLDRGFDLMYAKRAFVHQFVAEGMEEGEFSEARECMAASEKDYEEIGVETCSGEGEAQ